MMNKTFFAGYTAALITILIIGGLVFHEWKFVRKQAQPQPGACVVHACEECAKHADAKILMVRYNECELGHAYCVYTEGGRLFAWDWRGAVSVETPDYADDAASVAMWLTIMKPPMETPPLTVRSAAYEWSSNSR